MDFGLNEEQTMIVETTRAFVENELYPAEGGGGVFRRAGAGPGIREIQKKAIEAGFMRRICRLRSAVQASIPFPFV